MNAPLNHPLPLLELDVLRTFVAIAETGSFTAAANAVFRTPSAVSMQIKKLEDILGCSVLSRDARSVTMTTVGFGDIAPTSPGGQLIAALLMLMGYGIIAVPTGIVSAEIARADKHRKISTQVCPVCAQEGHDADAVYCKYCAGRL